MLDVGDIALSVVSNKWDNLVKYLQPVVSNYFNNLPREYYDMLDAGQEVLNKLRNVLLWKLKIDESDDVVKLTDKRSCYSKTLSYRSTYFAEVTSDMGLDDYEFEEFDFVDVDNENSARSVN